MEGKVPPPHPYHMRDLPSVVRLSRSAARKLRLESWLAEWFSRTNGILRNMLKPWIRKYLGMLVVSINLTQSKTYLGRTNLNSEISSIKLGCRHFSSLIIDETYKKAGWANHGEKPIKQLSARASTSVLALISCLWRWIISSKMK